MNQLERRLRFVGKTVVKFLSETEEDKLHLMIIAIVFIFCLILYQIVFLNGH